MYGTVFRLVSGEARRVVFANDESFLASFLVCVSETEA